MICRLTERFMALLILACAAIALWVPQSALWIDPAFINYLLALIMFGMGLTLRLSDFKLILTHPRDMLIGAAAQFTIMPALAYALGKGFGLESGLLAGVILVGTCPGGTASNVITFLSRGNLALSVGMTTLNTLLAPVLTPLITWFLLRTTVEVDTVSMFISIAQVVLLPIALGLLLHHVAEGLVKRIVPFMPTVSVWAIAVIIGCVVSHNAEAIRSTGFLILLVVILHNGLGFLGGAAIGRLCGLSPDRIKALSIEIGMQNSGLAVSLARSSFPDLRMATVPGAIFSVWHNISGAILAAIYRRWQTPDEETSVQDRG